MRTIPEMYTKNGWTYRLLTRQGNWAIYEQPAANRSWFELVRVRFAKSRVIAGKAIEEGEYLPSDAEWGRHGFTFQTKADALDRLNVLLGTPHTTQ